MYMTPKCSYINIYIYNINYINKITIHEYAQCLVTYIYIYIYIYIYTIYPHTHVHDPKMLQYKYIYKLYKLYK